MEPRPRHPAHYVAVARWGILAALALAVLLVGCAGGQTSKPSAPKLGFLVGSQGAAPQGLLGAARLARQFARAYATDAYRWRAPEIRPESASVRSALAAAAKRVPPARRGLRSRLLSLSLWLEGRGSVDASAQVGDRRFPPFSVGFTVSRRDGRWLVTSIALPD